MRLLHPSVIRRSSRLPLLNKHELLSVIVILVSTHDVLQSHRGPLILAAYLFNFTTQ